MRSVFNYLSLNLKKIATILSEVEAPNCNERHLAVRPNHQVAGDPNPEVAGGPSSSNKQIYLSNIECGTLSKHVVCSDQCLGASKVLEVGPIMHFRMMIMTCRTFYEKQICLCTPQNPLKIGGFWALWLFFLWGLPATNGR